MKEINSFTVTYIGGPTAILEIDGLRFITDPTLDPAGGAYQLGSLTLEKTKNPSIQDVGNIDIVLLSHDQHYDNLDNAGKLLLEKVSKTYTTVPGAERLKGTSVGLVPWQTDTVVTPGGNEITITGAPARHGPAGIERMLGEVTGFLLSVKGDKNADIYITGDTVYYEGIAEVAKRFSPSYVFIFAGAAQSRGPVNLTMGTNDAIDTAMAFPKATIIPLHYEGWKHFTQNEKDLQKAFRILGIDQRLKVLEAGLSAIFEL